MERCGRVQAPAWKQDAPETPCPPSNPTSSRQRRVPESQRWHARVARAGAGLPATCTRCLGCRPRPFPPARPAAAARTPGAAAGPGHTLPRDRRALRPGPRHAGPGQKHPGQRRDRRHRFRQRHALHGDGVGRRHRRWRAAAHGAGQDPARAGTRAGEPAALCAAGGERGSQPARLPRGGFHPRRRHLPQPGAHVGRGAAGGDGHARLLDGRRCLPDGLSDYIIPCAAARVPFSPGHRCSRPPPARSLRKRNGRRRDAYPHLRPGRLPGRGRCGWLAHRARRAGADRLEPRHATPCRDTRAPPPARYEAEELLG